MVFSSRPFLAERRMSLPFVISLLKINLRCGVLGAGVGNLQDYLTRLFIKCGRREDARKVFAFNLVENISLPSNLAKMLSLLLSARCHTTCRSRCCLE